MKRELDDVHVRVVNMRSASFIQIREGLEKRKYNFLKLSFYDEEENVPVPIDSNNNAAWTTKSIMNSYYNLDPQAVRIHQSDIICPINAYQKLRLQSSMPYQSDVLCPVITYRKLKSQSADIYLFITDYKVLKENHIKSRNKKKHLKSTIKTEQGNYGGSCDNTETYFYLSLYGITDYLRDENIRLSNFVQIAIYRDVLRHLCEKRIAHDKTKNCIFDTNSAERLSLISESCAKPKICHTCRKEIEETFIKKGIPIGYLTKTEKALHRLKKDFYYRVKDYINKYPLVSAIIAIFFSITINLIYDSIKLAVRFLKEIFLHL